MSDNMSYLKDIVAQLARQPRDFALAVAAEVFQQCVEATQVDSGQAAANWRYVPYQGEPAMESQTMMWGYGTTEPVAPAGYKWSSLDNGEAAFRFQFEQLIDVMASAPQHIDGVLVYNPITVGFAGFQPGDDAFYPENAFRSLDMPAIINTVMDRFYSEYNGSNG